MIELTQCELKHLGKDAELHENLRLAIYKSFENNEMMGYPYSIMEEEEGLFLDLIALRNLHDLPSDDKYFSCFVKECLNVDVV
jgi:hypothetical protein